MLINVFLKRTSSILLCCLFQLILTHGVIYTIVLIFIMNSYFLDSYQSNALNSVFKVHSSKEVYSIICLVAHRSKCAS